MRVTERGVTLVEVVVAATLTGAFALLAAGTVTRAGGALNRRAERFAAEQALRSANTSIRALLESNDPGGGDLLSATSSSLSTRVVRGAGVLCAADSNALVVRQDLDSWQSVRTPVAGRDSLLVGRITDPGWVAAALQASPVSRSCPDGSPGTAFSVALAPSDLAALGQGSPVRVFEPVELRSYLSSGSGWVGLRSIATGEAIQPLAGPLPGGGLWLRWLDWTGGPAALPRAVSALEFRITALTARSAPDSVAGFVSLKGALR